VLVAVPTASGKTRHPTRHHATVTRVRVAPHVIVVRIVVDRDDARMLCRSDLESLGLRAFIVRWAARHDVQVALSRCEATRERFRSALVERGSGTATVTTTTVSAATTAQAATPRSVPASVTLQGALSGARPLTGGTASVTVSADWSQMRNTGSGVLCAPATGSATLNGPVVKSAAGSASTGTIVMTLTGKLCQAGTATASASFAGTYAVGAGTTVGAASAAATGHGRFALTLGAGNAARFTAIGGLHS
jgi:hypothetical protein